jgi:hypothetical protein
LHLIRGSTIAPVIGCLYGTFHGCLVENAAGGRKQGVEDSSPWNRSWKLQLQFSLRTPLSNEEVPFSLFHVD